MFCSPTRVGALVVHVAMRERGCTALRARLYNRVEAEVGQTGERRHPGVRVALLRVRASDAHQPSGNVSARVRAGAGVDAGVGVGAGAGADVDAGAGAGAGADGDVDGDAGGVGVGAYGCGDASGCAHGCDRVDAGSILSFEEVVQVALLYPEEDEEGDGLASVDAGARADGSGGTD